MKYIFLLLITLAVFTRCKKDDPSVEAGEVSLNIYVKHHNLPIGNSRIFIKNATLAFPGHDTTQYDTRYVTDANGYFSLTDIGNGEKNMVIYAKGIDAGWDTSGTTPVWGFNTVSFSTSPGQDDVKTITIAVSE